MYHNIEAPNGIGTIRRIKVIDNTYELIERAVDGGAEIIINSNWRFTGKKYAHVGKLVQTNSIKHGKPKHIVWACYKDRYYVIHHPSGCLYATDGKHISEELHYSEATSSELGHINLEHELPEDFDQCYHRKEFF